MKFKRKEPSGVQVSILTGLLLLSLGLGSAFAQAETEAEVNTGFVPAFFNGRRNVQLAGKFIF